MTSYQKLKAENEKLKQDIYNLVRHENDMKGIEIKMKYKIQFDNTDIMWQGSFVTGDLTKFNGIISSMNFNGKQ